MTTKETNKRKCRVCGCTEDNCQHCIEKTGEPCHWVEDDLCSACVDINNAETIIENIPQELSEAEKTHISELENRLTSNNNNMNFFQLLAQASAQKTDLTIRIMQKETKLTINIMPGARSSFKPILITGTPQELDNEFFNVILPELNEIKGLVSNIDEVKKDIKKQLDEKSEAATKISQKKSEKKTIKKTAAKPEKKIEKEEEPNMFA
jgi:PRTRC genetic system protein E